MATVELVRSQLASGTGTISTTSAGRLFDAASTLLGLAPPAISYEGQAAILLEHAARRGKPTPSTAATVHDIVHELREENVPVPNRAWRFHAGLARVYAHHLAEAAHTVGVNWVGITGGCACNALLVELLRDALSQQGLTLLTHHHVPPNDGGLSLGQAFAGTLTLTNTR